MEKREKVDVHKESMWLAPPLVLRYLPFSQKSTYVVKVYKGTSKCGKGGVLLIHLPTK